MQSKTRQTALYAALSAAAASSFGLARCWRGLSLARGIVVVTLGASFGECVGDLVASGAYVRALVHDGHVPSTDVAASQKHATTHYNPCCRELVMAWLG